MNDSGVTCAATGGAVLSGQQTRFLAPPQPPRSSEPKVNRKPDSAVHAPDVLDTSLSTRTINAATDIIRWLVDNRLGVAKLFGALVVPAQFVRHDPPCLDRMNEACTYTNQNSNHRMHLDIAKYGDTWLKVAVSYPPDWPVADTSRCVLYHNPNAIVTANYLERHYDHAGSSGQDGGDFRPRYRHYGLKKPTSDRDTCVAHSPGIIQNMRKCPVIFYDYRGAGINEQVTPLFPTCETIVQDGQAVLHYALSHFDQVEIFGTSVGGAVATASLDRYQYSPDTFKDRIKSVNVLDSFSDTSHVPFPRLGNWIKTVGWLFGAELDGKKHLNSLISKGFNVAVSNHTHDEVIPPEARLAAHIPIQDVSRPNVQVHLSGRKTDNTRYKNHGTLTEDVQDFLNRDR